LSNAIAAAAIWRLRIIHRKGTLRLALGKSEKVTRKLVAKDNKLKRVLTNQAGVGNFEPHTLALAIHRLLSRRLCVLIIIILLD
jgi:hypothetical protein